MFRTHPETAISIGEPQGRPYLPNYDFDNRIDAFHRRLGECPRNGTRIDLGIGGWLRREDALKLYEAAYFASGDILELGTYLGLSTYILAQGLSATGRDGTIVTIDVSSEYSKQASRNLRERGVADKVELRVGDANEVCGELVASERRFGLAFVDHSHSYEDVALACRHLSSLVHDNALCIFHDYNDSRNTRAIGVGESNSEYGVFAAVEDYLGKGQFAFVGVYGACGVFLKQKSA